jgi:hypothetical protein
MTSNLTSASELDGRHLNFSPRAGKAFFGSRRPTDVRAFFRVDIYLQTKRFGIIYIPHIEEIVRNLENKTQNTV